MSRPERPNLPAEATEVHGESLSAADSPRNRLAAAVRRVSSLAVGGRLDDAAMDQAAAAIEAAADVLAQGRQPGKRPRGQPEASGHPQDFFVTSPMVGRANPIAPPVDVWAARGEGDQLELHGRAWFDYPYEGPPTCVHGGVIAELFDELLGSVNILRGRAGMTGTLSIRYRKPTPLLTELELVARQTGIEGRKIFAWGGIYHRGELTAEAEGIFIEMVPAKMVELVTANVAVAGDDVVDTELARFVAERGDLPEGEQMSD